MFGTRQALVDSSKNWDDHTLAWQRKERQTIDTQSEVPPFRRSAVDGFSGVGSLYLFFWVCRLTVGMKLRSVYCVRAIHDLDTNILPRTKRTGLYTHPLILMGT